MPGKFELKQAKGGKYMFNLLAPNGEIILTSQRYASKHGARNGISCVMTCAPTEASFERRTTKSGQGYFVMKSRNGRVVGQSEQYKSNRALENGIQSVRRNATKARVEDRTLR